MLFRSLAAKLYGTSFIQERHRHRYEFNNDYLERFEQAGLRPTGINSETGLVEIVELAGHPWFVGVQFHPELKSTVMNPHPLFVAFVRASLTYSQQQRTAGQFSHAVPESTAGTAPADRPERAIETASVVD